MRMPGFCWGKINSPMAFLFEHTGGELILIPMIVAITRSTSRTTAASGTHTVLLQSDGTAHDGAALAVGGHTVLLKSDGTAVTHAVVYVAAGGDHTVPLRSNGHVSPHDAEVSVLLKSDGATDGHVITSQNLASPCGPLPEHASPGLSDVECGLPLITTACLARAF